MFTIKYSPVNMAHIVLFGDSILRIFNEKEEAEAYLACIQERVE